MDLNRFSFEELEVWQKAVEFTRIVLEVSESIGARNKHYRLIEQLESASSSIALNIAEGKGRYSKKEFIHYLYVARGSLFETITLLLILGRSRIVTEAKIEEMKNRSFEIGKMLSGLINSIKTQL